MENKNNQTFPTFFKWSPLFYIADKLSNAQSGSNLSLASATTNEADSVNSGGAGSQR